MSKKSLSVMMDQKLSSGFGIGGGIVSILFAGGVIASQFFIPDIKFIKSK